MQDNLSVIYWTRFAGKEAYRQTVWRVLISQFFGHYIPSSGAVLDLGCGYGEFINQVNAAKRYGMDLNPDSRKHLNSDICLLEQDCSVSWQLPENSLDLVFTSNFFEHLPGKSALSNTLKEALRCLKPGGRLIAMGPNIKYLPGAYWDFWDHYLPLTEASLAEGLQTTGFELERVIPRFLPYTMSNGPRYPMLLLRIYLCLRFFWPMFGRQFLVIGRK